jgi:MoaA/NifB/PqqE/SkfB family radical SAM enzyme
MFKNFDRGYLTETYALLFNTQSGVEILQGINGNDDPFFLQMPSLLDIGVMGTCKHKCVFCYQGHEQKPNMTLSDFRRVIDQVKDYTNQVALGGRGDPNKHENFKEIIEYCRKNNVVPNYTTSGIDLTPDEIEISKMCGAVAVSEYEAPYTYKAITNLIDAGIKTNIHQIYTNQTHIKSLHILLGYIPAEWKFDYSKLNAIIFLLFKPQGAGKDVKYLMPTEAQIKDFSKFVFKDNGRFKIGMDSCLINHVLKYSNPTELQRMSIDTCEAGRMSAYITQDLKFKPCSFAEKHTEVDLTKDTIENVWNNSKPFSMFRYYLTCNPDICPIQF